MTDHNREEREALIEKAAYERYPDIEADPPGTSAEDARFPTGWSREQERSAFIAGAVFERAHTPTDDERVFYCPRHGDLLPRDDDPVDVRSARCQEAHTVAQIHASFRRTVQGEPTDTLGRFSFDGAEGIAFWVGDSDEESTVKVMFSELMDLAKFLCDNFPGLFKAESDGAHLKAEPTDAQVEAAWKVIDTRDARAITHDDIRAALRAANETRGDSRG